VKIREVTASNRKRVFVVHSTVGVYGFPYAKVGPAPTPEDPLDRVYVDPELGSEGFTYLLRSGEIGALHVDNVLGYNDDPSIMGDWQLHLLTIRAEKLVKASGMSKREICRRLRTSASQLARLLDPANHNKSMRQLLALLHLLGYEVKFEVRKKEKGVTA
jgi:hypothetical protein